MFKNYFKTAIRNLLRYKGFAFINILSLTIGIVGCLVIGLFVWDEQQFDKHIPNADNIYRIYEERTDNSGLTFNAPVPPAYTDFLQRQFPEVDTTTRIMMLGDKYLLENGDKQAYEDKGLFVDPSFAHFFSLKFTKGDPATALAAPASIVLTEDLAKKYFGTENPVGKSIFLNKDTLQVTGVLAALPSHFHLDFRYLMPIAALNIPATRMEKWGWHQFYSYIRLKPGTSPVQVQDKFQAYIRKEILPKESEDGTVYMPRFQPLRDVHLKSSDFVYDNAVRGNETYVKALTIIALFVLAIACFNFINLATARSLRRAKEIGVRKVVGADRKQLIFQFIGETILLSLFSMVLAMIATLFIIPLLNEFTGKSISFRPITNPLLGLLMLAGGVFIGMLAGIYPAVVLSGFQPIKVLKDMKLTSNRSWLRPALVVVQFSLSVLLIVCTLIVYRQTKYLNNKDLGFSKEQVLYFNVHGDITQKLDAFKDELRQSPNVVAVTSGYGMPGDAFAGESIKLPTKDGEKQVAVSQFIGDHDYLKTLGLQLIAGRDFSRQRSTDVREAFIINETAAKTFGFNTPEAVLGQEIRWDEWQPLDSTQPVKSGKVIGVVKDFHYKSLHEKVTASVIQLYPQVTETVAVKLRGGDMETNIAYVSNVWGRYAPGFPLDYKFVDETYGKMYSSEEKLSSLLWIFAIMAIVVGCMGLFGLAAFSAEQRTKEFGIRKVLGANVLNIMGLLSKNFLVLVVIAAVIAFPVAWWAMNNWLDDFPYRVAISWWIFGIAIVAALLIALITVSFQSIKVATANPVKSLRTE
ncbi:MAG: FtsX-like permease family protein [Chitinophagaceae bacterium]|nr:MAG: FtsX-like permease family protein [Chitinophagaceae bacterium]